jgi:hypothetical protein
VSDEYPACDIIEGMHLGNTPSVLAENIEFSSS